MARWKPNSLLNYTMVIFFEEGLFRVIILGFLMLFLSNWASVIIMSLLFGVMHFVKYDWRMVASALALGVGLGWLFIWLPYPLNFAVCVAVHLGIGSLGVYFKCMERWLA